MNAPQDHDHALLAAGGIAAALIAHKAAIVSRFEGQMRGILPAEKVPSSPILTDSLPTFLTDLALALSTLDPRVFAGEFTNVALQHGNERARFTDYTLSDVVKEYQVLRQIIVDVLHAAPDTPSAEDLAVIHRSIDEAIGESASAFAQVQLGLREQFVAVLTHDFRGPLSAARNYLEIIRRTADLAQRDHASTRAIANLERMGRMISELLHVSRTSAGERLQASYATCDLSQLVRELLGDLTIQAGPRFDADLPVRSEAVVDADLIRQALHNLLENAIKYGLHDGRITVRLVCVNERIHLSVHNLGSAIPPEELPTLFKPFRRSPTAEYSGTRGWGLGLTMVEAVAEAHAGAVTVESNSAHGTTFTIDILRDAAAYGAGHGT